MQRFEALNGFRPDIREIKRRKDYVKNITIYYPRYKEIKESIQEQHILSLGSIQPDGMFLTGETGVGKTTILMEYADEYPRYEANGVTKVPILYFKVPVGATPKSVASEMLLKLGDPAFDKGTLSNITARIYHFIKVCEVQMVIMDEFQHLIDRDTQHVLNRASDWVKTFVDEVKVSVILCGMPESERIFKHNPQLDRRFCIRRKLEHFKYATKDDQIEFRTFLKSLDGMLPFTKPSNLAGTILSEKLYYASLGVPFYVKKVIEEATVVALKHGNDYITEDDFYEGFRSIEISNRSYVVNPFNQEEFHLLDALKEESKKG